MTESALNEIAESSESDTRQIRFLWEDDAICVIHKPPRMLVHPRSRRKGHHEVTVLQRLREQLLQDVYSVHRLDRATSGVMVCAKSRQAAAELCRQFRDGEVVKSYFAVVRGFLDEPIVIDRPLNKRSASGRRLDVTVPAVSRVSPQYQYELPIPCGRFQTTRCSLIDLRPDTGRWHQLRRHLNHVSHPIIGDVEHGDNSQNRMYRERFQLRRLLLASTQLRFAHPISGQDMQVTCDPDEEFQEILERLQPYKITADAVPAWQSSHAGSRVVPPCQSIRNQSVNRGGN